MLSVRRVEGVNASQRATTAQRAAVVQNWIVLTKASSDKTKGTSGVLERWQSVQRSRKEWKRAAAKEEE
jgi:hypothetical protein